MNSVTSRETDLKRREKCN